MNSSFEKCSTLTADQLNATDLRSVLGPEALRAQISEWMINDELFRMITEERPFFIAKSPVFLNEDCLSKQLEIISALERVIAMAEFQEKTLETAPQSARFLPKSGGVFLGYDFHVSADGPKLIEINSNAGGAFINVLLTGALEQISEPQGSRISSKFDVPQTRQDIEQSFFDMFCQEWRDERGNEPLRSIAIVDDMPESQYMLPEFFLFKQFFERRGIKAVICDPAELVLRDSALWWRDLQIDLVYNRLTDFGLEEVKHGTLLDAYLSKATVLTPHPRNHAIYANKQNLVLLSNLEFLRAIGVDEETCSVLMRGVAGTFRVSREQADRFWRDRKKLFFKPAKGYGSKAAYRGDKLTLSVFNEIIGNDYVAQTLIKPSERRLEIAGEIVDLKLDLRHYVYRGQTQLICARLYQGQTTNFRTPGGGFAPVLVVA